MTDEDYAELRQEMLEDSRADELLEYKLRSDYDEFCDHYINEIAELQEVVRVLEVAHESYGWDFDLKALL